MGISSADAQNPKVELDGWEGSMVYEVEFCYNGTEYDFDLNAVTGEVVKSGQEPCDHNGHHSGGTSGGNGNNGNSGNNGNNGNSDKSGAKSRPPAFRGRAACFSVTNHPHLTGYLYAAAA